MCILKFINKLLLSLLIMSYFNLSAQEFKSIGYYLNNDSYLVKGLQTGVKELEFKNQNNKVRYFLKWKKVIVDTDVFYNGEFDPYYLIAIGDKSSDTVVLKFHNKYEYKQKRKRTICKRKFSIFLIKNGMYIYELKEY
jgi:hypothetical protein